MVRPVGNPIADDTARFMAVVADAEHGGDERPLSRDLPRGCPADSLARPVKNAQIEARSVSAIRAAASELQAPGPRET
jgi:hypothetical protein